MNQILYTSNINYEKLTYITRCGELRWFIKKNNISFLTKIILCIKMCDNVILDRNDDIIYDLTIEEKEDIMENIMKYSIIHPNANNICQYASNNIKLLMKKHIDEINYIIS